MRNYKEFRNNCKADYKTCSGCGCKSLYSQKCNSCTKEVICEFCGFEKKCKECYVSNNRSSMFSRTKQLSVIAVFLLLFFSMSLNVFADLQLEGLQDYTIASDGKYMQLCRGLQCDMEFSIYKNDSSDIHNFTIELQDNLSNTLDINDYIHTVHLYHKYNITLGNGTYEERREEITFNQLEDVVINQLSGETNYFHLYFDLLDNTKFFDLVPNWDRPYNEYAWFFPHDTDGTLKYYFDFSNGKPYGSPDGDLFNLGDGTIPFYTNNTNSSNFPSSGGINVNESEQEYYASLGSDDATNAQITFSEAADIRNDLGNNWGVNFWVRGDSADFSGANYNIFRFKEPGGNAVFDLITLTNGSIRFDLQDSNANELQTYIGTITTTFLNTSWRHIHVGLEDLGADVHEFKYYLDSNLLFAVNKTGFTGETWPNSCDHNAGDCSFSGEIGSLNHPILDYDEVRIYSKVLNQTEIDDTWNGTINVSGTPPTFNESVLNVSYVHAGIYNFVLNWSAQNDAFVTSNETVFSVVTNNNTRTADVTVTTDAIRNVSVEFLISNVDGSSSTFGLYNFLPTPPTQNETNETQPGTGVDFTPLIEFSERLFISVIFFIAVFVLLLVAMSGNDMGSMLAGMVGSAMVLFWAFGTDQVLIRFQNEFVGVLVALLVIFICFISFTKSKKRGRR